MSTANGARWCWPSERRGNFGFRSLVSTFEFQARDAFVDREYFGLAPMGTYFFAVLEDADGNIIAPIRKCTAELSTGLQLSSNVGRDDLEIDPKAFLGSSRGAGITWRLAEDEQSFTVAADATPFGAALEIEVADDSMSWAEGELLGLTGRRLGRGYQWYTPNHDERGGNFYGSIAYEARGHAMGRAVRGHASVDTFYGPIGQVYKSGPIFNAVELAWVAFANTYDDGAFEVGGLCFGKRYWGFAVVCDTDGEVFAITEPETEVELDGDEYVRRAVYHTPAGDWVFDASERGQMRSLAEARGDAYHGQAGRVRRVGDDRTPAASTAWMESFPLNGLGRER